MIISKSKNFIFIHPQKTGGTSIEEFLTQFLSDDDLLIGGITKGRDNANYYRDTMGFQWMQEIGLWTHSSSKDIIRNIGNEDWNKYYKFATVRNPVQISISLYFHIKRLMFSQLKNINSININNVVYDDKLDTDLIIKNDMIITDDLNYIDFLKSIKNNTGINGFIIETINNNRSFLDPQTNKIDNTVELYDIEFIDEFWKVLLNKLNIDTNEKLPIFNKANRDEPYKLQGKTIDLIKNHFKSDYEIIPFLTKTNWK